MSLPSSPKACEHTVFQRRNPCQRANARSARHRGLATRLEQRLHRVVQAGREGALKVHKLRARRGSCDALRGVFSRVARAAARTMLSRLMVLRRKSTTLAKRSVAATCAHEHTRRARQRPASQVPQKRAAQRALMRLVLRLLQDGRVAGGLEHHHHLGRLRLCSGLAQRCGFCGIRHARHAISAAVS